jgi:hypothetical protein
VDEIDLTRSRTSSLFASIGRTLFLRLHDGRKLLLNTEYHSPKDIRRFVEAVKKAIAGQKESATRRG